MEGQKYTPEDIDLAMTGAEAEDKERSKKVKNFIGYQLDKKPDEYWPGYNNQKEHDAHVGDLAGSRAMVEEVYRNALAEAESGGLNEEDSLRFAEKAKRDVQKTLRVEENDILNDV